MTLNEKRWKHRTVSACTLERVTAVLGRCIVCVCSEAHREKNPVGCGSTCNQLREDLWRGVIVVMLVYYVFVHLVVGLCGVITWSSCCSRAGGCSVVKVA